MVGQQVLHTAAIVHSHRLAGDGVVFPHCAGFHAHFVGAAHEIQAGQRAGAVIIDLLGPVAVAVVGEGPGGEHGAAGAVTAHQGDDRQAVFGVEVLLKGLAVLQPAGHVAVRVVGIGVAVGESRDRSCHANPTPDLGPQPRPRQSRAGAADCPIDPAHHGRGAGDDGARPGHGRVFSYAAGAGGDRRDDGRHAPGLPDHAPRDPEGGVIGLQITLTALVLSLLIAVTFERFVELVDRRAAARISRSEQPKASAASVLEGKIGGWLSRLVPGYLRQVASDLYWASFTDGKLQGRTPAAVFMRQLLITLGVGFAAYLA